MATACGRRIRWAVSHSHLASPTVVDGPGRSINTAGTYSNWQLDGSNSEEGGLLLVGELLEAGMVLGPPLLLQAVDLLGEALSVDELRQEDIKEKAKQHRLMLAPEKIWDDALSDRLLFRV